MAIARCATLPPREMRDWVAIDRAALLKRSSEIAKLRSGCERSSEKLAGLRSELGLGLSRLGEPPDHPAESLVALLERAKGAVARVGVAVELVDARRRLAEAQAELAAWRSRWASAVGPLGLEDDASPARALNAQEGIDQAIKVMEQAASIGREIEEAATIERRWEEAVSALIDRLGRGRAGADFESIARGLAAGLDRAKEARTKREGLLAMEATERARLLEAEAKAERADTTLAMMVREARCRSSDDLPEAERASDDLKEWRKRLRNAEEMLAELAGDSSIEEFLAQADGVDRLAIEAKIAALDGRLATLKQEADRLREEIGGCAEHLKRMDGRQAAADDQQAVEERVAGLAFDVERYARLRLASAVLRDAIKSYQEKHQGPVLGRASSLFARLTAGSFSGLRPDLDQDGRPVLLGVRDDGTTLLGVSGMSEGTADQLYLALRLASLETYLDDHEPMPMVVDDILVNFDNARALAALRALAGLSRRTQVLFFTHHDHLVELARSTLGEDVLFVHHLSHPPAIANGHREEGPSVVEAARPRRKRKPAASSGEESEFLR